MTNRTTETILREQVAMWRRTAHFFGIGLIAMSIACALLGILNLMR
jgi:hypothetical protein